MKQLLLEPCFIFILLVISVTNTPTCLCVDDARYTNCSNAFSCGNNNFNLKYPFWGENRDNHCGGPNSESEKLTCEAQVPKITINFIKYRVLGWENTSQILKVARDNYWDNNVCVNGDRNSTFDNTPFQYDYDGLVNVTLFYDCPASSSPPTISSLPASSVLTFPCGGAVYYTVQPLPSSYESPCNIVVIPIFNDSLYTPDRIIEALQGGFQIEWTGNYDKCEKCTGSGGECGSVDGNFQCFCKDGPHSASCKGKNNWKTKLIIGLTGALMGGFMMCIIVCCNKCKSSTQVKYSFTIKNGQDIESFLKNHGALAQKRYKFSEVKKMTNSFKVKLGEGGFGAVYKGEQISGGPVAVKILNESKGNGEDFINEVASISRTSHVNVVTLVGFCLEGRKKALIYEFMPNGSLDKFIYKEGLETTASLSWDNFWQIAIGIARGLEYLHRGCNTRILHFDIKPHNILLDENFCPKISDFGLAKLCPRKESIVSMSDARGTIGYVAPEVWNRNFGGVSHKSDVYSYGMMLLEMVGGRKNINAEASHTSEIYFPHWIYNKLEQGGDLRPNTVIASEEENEIVKRMTLVGLWCVQTFPKDRPTMTRVVDMLEGKMDSLEIPPKPVLSSPTVSSVPESPTR
ncbi:hypothetical protein AAZX31_18G275300 [Glycine max]